MRDIKNMDPDEKGSREIWRGRKRATIIRIYNMRKLYF